jgi:hypothetical protein
MAIGLFFDGTPFTMAIVMCFCAFLANMILFVIGNKMVLGKG